MSSTVIFHTKIFFPYFRIPKVDTTDNDSEYIVEKYKKFLNKCDFKLTTVSTRYPDSNELVESKTETVMKNLEKNVLKMKMTHTYNQ